VTEAPLAPLLEGDPRFAEVVPVPAKSNVRETLGLVSRLRAFAPDVAFDFFCNPRSAVWTRASGARVRVGYPNKGWRSALYTHHARPRTLSAVGFHLASLAAVGWPAGPLLGATAPDFGEIAPRLHVGAGARDEAAAALAQLGVPAG